MRSRERGRGGCCLATARRRGGFDEGFALSPSSLSQRERERSERERRRGARAPSGGAGFRGSPRRSGAEVLIFSFSGGKFLQRGFLLRRRIYGELEEEESGVEGKEIRVRVSARRRRGGGVEGKRLGLPWLEEGCRRLIGGVIWWRAERLDPGGGVVGGDAVTSRARRGCRILQEVRDQWRGWLRLRARGLTGDWSSVDRAWGRSRLRRSEESAREDRARRRFGAPSL